MTQYSPQTDFSLPKPSKAYKGVGMEGWIAQWYAKIREQDPELGWVVRQVSEQIPADSKILEVAPGPGFLAIKLAKLGKYQVFGVDISKSTSIG